LGGGGVVITSTVFEEWNLSCTSPTQIENYWSISCECRGKIPVIDPLHIYLFEYWTSSECRTGVLPKCDGALLCCKTMYVPRLRCSDPEASYFTPFVGNASLFPGVNTEEKSHTWVKPIVLY
jgi:hypothetical protein